MLQETTFYYSCKQGYKIKGVMKNYWQLYYNDQLEVSMLKSLRFKKQSAVHRMLFLRIILNAFQRLDS